MSNAAHPTQGQADCEDNLAAQPRDIALFWSVVITGLIVIGALVARGFGLLPWWKG